VAELVAISEHSTFSPTYRSVGPLDPFYSGGTEPGPVTKLLRRYFAFELTDSLGQQPTFFESDRKARGAF